VKKTLLVLLALSLVACDCNPMDALRGTMGSPSEEQARVSPPSDAATQAFVESFVAAAASGDAGAVDDHFDWHAVARRAASGLNASKEFIDQMAESASEASKERGISSKLASVPRGEVRLRHLGAQERDGEVWQIFRLTMSEGGFEHLALLLEDKRKRARAVDLWQLTVGDTTSAIMRRMILPVMGDDLKRIVNRLTGHEQAFVEHMNTIIEAQRLNAEGRGHDALHLLDELPESLKKERFVMLQRVAMAQLASPNEHLIEIEALAEAFPDDPTTQVHLIDGYALQGKPRRSLDAIDRVEALTVTDPYLDVLRANILGALERWPEARVAAERAIEREPELEDAYWPALVATLMEKDFAETTRLLIVMREKLDVAIDPEQLPIYEDYLRSPEYDAFKRATAD
jgi:hypothetical protein